MLAAGSDLQSNQSEDPSAIAVVLVPEPRHPSKWPSGPTLRSTDQSHGVFASAASKTISHPPNPVVQSMSNAPPLVCADVVLQHFGLPTSGTPMSYNLPPPLCSLAHDENDSLPPAADSDH